MGNSLCTGGGSAAVKPAASKQTSSLSRRSAQSTGSTGEPPQQALETRIAANTHVPPDMARCVSTSGGHTAGAHTAGRLSMQLNRISSHLNRISRWVCGGAECLHAKARQPAGCCARGVLQGRLRLMPAASTAPCLLQPSAAFVAGACRHCCRRRQPAPAGGQAGRSH